MDSRFERLNEFRTSHAGIILFYSYLVALLIAAVLITVVFVRLSAVAKQNRRALCALKTGYQQDLARTNDYLKAHPNGNPALGLSRADLLIVKTTTEMRLQSLKDIKGC